MNNEWRDLRNRQMEYNVRCMNNFSEYLNGFKLNDANRKPMFEDELKDLELVYRKELIAIRKDIESDLPYLIDYMKDFVKQHERTEELNDKLQVLLAKMERSL